MEFYSHYYQNKSGEFHKQTVTEHCRAAATYAKSSLSSVKLGNAAYLAALLHDMGKMKQEFQSYLLSGISSRGSVNHSFAACRMLLQSFHANTAASYEDLTAELLAYAAGAHHGLFDCVDTDGNLGFLHRLETSKIGYEESLNNYLSECADHSEINQLFQIANSELLPIYARIDTLAQESDEECSFYFGLLARLLLSAVIDGDRRDTAEFVTGVHAPEPPKDWKLFWKPYLQYMENKLAQFPQDTPIQKARAEISQKCREFAENHGSIIRLNVPTGSGKTLSSLRYALAHAQKWGKQRLIFTSPLLTILEQNAAEIRKYLGDDSIVLEHHSNVLKTDESPDLDLHELAVERWDAPVIITTLVQLLNTMFSGKTTSIRRFQSLCNSVIVIDEVQTVPSQMLTLFDLGINFLVDICGATIVLCSATQPCLDKVKHSIHPTPTEMIPYDPELWHPFRRTNIIDAGKKTLEETVYFIRECMDEIDNLLIICNKKSEAIYFSNSLSGGLERIFHLSAAMCPAHRRETLAQLYDSLANGKRCICVATQVIEAGVDISFQCVIRLTAGMDSVIQAAGRCNRNASEKIAPVYIVTLLNENLSYLKEIQRGKSATIDLLSAYNRQSEKFGSSLESKEAIDYYYNRFFNMMAREAQDYTLPEKKTTLFSLLSDNLHSLNKNSTFSDRFFLNQAFRTAGDAFTVFDSDTYDVIVPYGDGKQLIIELLSQPRTDVAFLKSWVENAKPYTVSLYAYQIQALSGVITEYDGVRILAPEYYDAITGFRLNPNQLDFLEG